MPVERQFHQISEKEKIILLENCNIYLLYRLFNVNDLEIHSSPHHGWINGYHQQVNLKPGSTHLKT